MGFSARIVSDISFIAPSTSRMSQISTGVCMYLLGTLMRAVATPPLVSWMANQQAKGPSFERVVDYKKADSLKNALAHATVDLIFLNHVRASVAGAKK